MLRPAMHDAVAECRHPKSREARVDKVQDRPQRLGLAGALAQMPLLQHRAIGTLRDQPGIPAQRIDKAGKQRLRRLGCPEKPRLQRRRAGVQGQDRAHPRALAQARYSTASAQEASRALSSSARLVRMIGTAAPSTRPAASAWAM
jgi:hypothetical protein